MALRAWRVTNLSQNHYLSSMVLPRVQSRVLHCSPLTLFISLSDVIKQHDCDYHKYADDTQLEEDTLPRNVTLAHNCLEHFGTNM